MNERVKEWRKVLGMSQKELGIAIGKDKKAARYHIDNIERGKQRLAADDYVAIQELLKQRSGEAENITQSTSPRNNGNDHKHICVL